MEETNTFNRGDQVKDAGEYICVPCGFKKTYAEGETFGECLSCMAGTLNGNPEFTEGLELWEKV